MDLGLRGRSALVTGGSRGLGLGTAELLAEEGCDLHLAARSASDLEAAAQRIRHTYHVTVTCHALDLSSTDQAQTLARACRDVDILVNNAGAIPRGTIGELDEKTWRDSWELKVWGYIALVREMYPLMRERGHGVIVNVIGTAGERPFASAIAGSMGNASLMALTRALGAESPDWGVRVVGINPGATETSRQVLRWQARAERELGSADRWRELITAFPFGRLATVAEVVNTIVFLCSDRSSYTSGTIVTVDGGDAGRMSVIA